MGADGNMNNDDNTGVDTGKTFTQEEVNNIVSDRLKREREKLSKENDEKLAEREKAISAREMRMNALEKLQQSGLPGTLVDAINCTDEESMNKSIEILRQNYNGGNKNTRHSIYNPQNGGIAKDDPIRDAMRI